MNSQKEKNLDILFNTYINYCAYSSRLSKDTIRGYKDTYKLFRLIMQEIVTVEDLLPCAMDDFFKRLETRERIVGKGEKRIGVKDTTIKTYWTKLNSFFVWLVNNHYIEMNPLYGKKSPKVRYDDFKRLTDEDISKIVTAITQEKTNALSYYRNMFMVYLFLFTGVRRTEFISLRLTDIDMFKRVVTIRGETSKSKRTRVLKINSILFMHLNNYIEERRKLKYKTDSLIVSTIKDRGLSIEGLKHWTERIKQSSGVKFHVHQFRHTFACKLVEANVNIYKIKELLGHTDIRMTVKYLRSLNTADMGADLELIYFK